MEYGQVSFALLAIGCHRQSILWAAPYDDFHAAWRDCNRGDWLAVLLKKLGLSFDTVLAPLQRPLGTRLNLRPADNIESPFAVRRAVLLFRDAVGVSLQDIADIYRAEFEFSVVEEALRGLINNQWEEVE